MTSLDDTTPEPRFAILDQISNRQAVLSTTANVLKWRLDRVRYSCLVLSVVGATLAAIASGLTAEDYRVYLIWPATGMLALGTFLGSRLLGQDSVAKHVKARLASESLKREAYLYATFAGDYSDAHSRAEILFERLTEIDTRVASLSRQEQEGIGIGSCPREFLSATEYIAERVVAQIGYYRRRAVQMGRASRMLHGAEFVLGASAAVITAVAALSDKGGFDVAALTAVITTLGGIVVAHLQAGRYDDQIGTYRITANRLEAYKATVTSTTPVANVAETVEEIIACETSSWQTLWLENA